MLFAQPNPAPPTRYNELTVGVRQLERELRQVRRELAPLGQGMAVKVRRDRVVRLRNRVRREAAAAVAVQRTFRGWRLRRALFSWYRDYWVAQEDEATGALVYYNTWSEEVRWSQPLEMTLLPHLAKDTPPPAEEGEGAGEDEDGDEDEEEEDEDEEGGGEAIEGGYDGGYEVAEYGS